MATMKDKEQTYVLELSYTTKKPMYMSLRKNTTSPDRNNVPSMKAIKQLSGY